MRDAFYIVAVVAWPMVCCWLYSVGPEWLRSANNVPWGLSCGTAWFFLWCAGLGPSLDKAPNAKPIRQPQRTASSEIEAE